MEEAEPEAHGMEEAEGCSDQLVPGRGATAAKASFGKSGFAVLAPLAFLSIFVLPFISHPTVSSASPRLAAPQPAVLSSLAPPSLATAGVTDRARVPEPQLPHVCYGLFPFIKP